MVDAPEPSPGRDLRFAVATEDPPVAWQALGVQRLASVPGVSIVAWIRRPPHPRRRRSGSGARALAPAAAPELLAELPSTIRGADGSDAPEVDVVVDLTAGGIAGSEAGSSAIWRFRYGDDLRADAFRAALADYVRHPGNTRVALVETTSGRILRDGRLQWWRGEELDRLLLDPGPWLADAARRRLERDDVADDGPGALAAGRTLVSRPLLQVAAYVRRTIGVAGSLLRHEDWNIGIVDEPIGAIATGDAAPAVRWLTPRPGRYAADPFGLECDGTLHILFEDYDQRAARGTIARIAIGPDGAVSEPELVLDLGVHSSYPYLFRHDGRIYLLPETAALRKVVLYEAVSFPTEFRPVATLMDGVPMVDTTVVEYGGKWWMFATRRDFGVNHSLWIWHAPDLLGPWTGHAANPVKTDAGSARPGGTPFIVDGVLYRPSQDSTRAYGGRMIVNRVEVLTETRFVERPVRMIGPQGSRYRHGLHTLSAAGSRTLVDGNREHFVVDALRHDLAVGFRRIARRSA